MIDSFARFPYFGYREDDVAAGDRLITCHEEHGIVYHNVRRPKDNLLEVCSAAQTAVRRLLQSHTTNLTMYNWPSTGTLLLSSM
jgi:hypothetical protein